jgi:hypothetical protein
MAVEQNPYNIKATFVATDALCWNPTDESTNHLFRFVKITTDVVTSTPVVDAIGNTHWSKPIGILQNQPKHYASGNAEAEVTIAGICKVVVGDTDGITAGQRIGAGEYGYAVGAASDDADAAWAVGTALGSGAAGDIIEVLVNCTVPFKAAKA